MSVYIGLLSQNFRGPLLLSKPLCLFKFFKKLKIFMCVHASAYADMCAHPYENQGSASGVNTQELSISFLTQIFSLNLDSLSPRDPFRFCVYRYVPPCLAFSSGSGDQTQGLMLSSRHFTYGTIFTTLAFMTLCGIVFLSLKQNLTMYSWLT